MHLGIDPGTVNIGVAVTDDEGNLLRSEVLNSKETGFNATVVQIALIRHDYELKTLGMERYVAYKGMHSGASEEILMIIGAIRYAYADYSVSLFRAIDWKPTLCKYLVKHKGFSNPSTSFDKKYSRAAAQCITGQKVKTDHEADAICLSFMWKVYVDKIDNKKD